MRFSLKVDMDGAAFEDNPSEVHDLLRGLADRLAERDAGTELADRIGDSGTLLDSNGNTCGRWEVTA